MRQTTLGPNVCLRPQPGPPHHLGKVSWALQVYAPGGDGCRRITRSLLSHHPGPPYTETPPFLLSGSSGTSRSSGPQHSHCRPGCPCAQTFACDREETRSATREVFNLLSVSSHPKPPRRRAQSGDVWSTGSWAMKSGGGESWIRATAEGKYGSSMYHVWRHDRIWCLCHLPCHLAQGFFVVSMGVRPRGAGGRQRGTGPGPGTAPTWGP